MTPTITAVFAWNGQAIVIGVTHLTGAPVTVSDLDAFQQPADPAGLTICRGCSERGLLDERVGTYGTVTESHGSLIHSCDGNGCQCPTCDILATVREMTADWDQRDREQGWRA